VKLRPFANDLFKLEIRYERDLLAGTRSICGRHRSIHDFRDPSWHFLGSYSECSIRWTLDRHFLVGSRAIRLPENNATRQPNSFHLHDAELLLFGNNEFEPNNACQSLLASIEREEAFEFELKRTGDVQYIKRLATDRGGVLTT
jgi:hypothetical protein